MISIFLLIAIVAVAMVLLGSSVRVINQYERGVIMRFGRLRDGTRGPGLAVIAPMADRLHKVNMQIVTMAIPAQDGITRDNVTVKVDAVVYYRVVDPIKVVVDVQNYDYAIGQVAQASLRSIIGKSDLDDLLSNRERLNQGLELMIDSPALDWGVHIDRVEIKDVALPETMKRSMSRQAEAERERRSRVITAEGELQASQKLAQAAEVMTEHPAALQLRLLQTVVEVAAEKNSTLVLPFPVELLRFLERSTPSEAAASQATEPEVPEVPEVTEPTPPPAVTSPEPASAPVGLSKPQAVSSSTPQAVGSATPQAVNSATPQPVNSATPETVGSSEPEALPSPSPAAVASSRPAAVASSN
jgi:regulator of protease activity HflC (stomatin/prohibitin superfamily)